MEPVIVKKQLFYSMCHLADVPVVAAPPEWSPDFWLPDIRAWIDRTGVAVEISDEDEDPKGHRAAFRATGIDLVVMDKARLMDLSASTLRNRLRLAVMWDNPRSDD